MTREESLRMLEDALEVEEGSITPDTVLDDIEEYTSLAKLGIAVAFADNYDIKLTGEQFAQFKTVGDILDLIPEDK